MCIRDSSCTLCPRACRADRAAGQRGFCGADDTLRIARAALHHWEEPCLSGDPSAATGSGTVFFSGCTLKCCYCQNYPISQGSVGKAVTAARLAEIFMNLQSGGAKNLNLVTASHYLPWIVEEMCIRDRDSTMLRLELMPAYWAASRLRPQAFSS